MYLCTPNSLSCHGSKYNLVLKTRSNLLISDLRISDLRSQDLRYQDLRLRDPRSQDPRSQDLRSQISGSQISVQIFNSHKAPNSVISKILRGLTH